MHFLNVAAPSPSEMMLLPLTWQHWGGSAGTESGPALGPCPYPCPRPCPVLSHPAAAPTPEQLHMGSLAGAALLPPQAGPMQLRMARGERRSLAMLVCTWGRRAAFVRPHTSQWTAPQRVTWGKRPAFAQGGSRTECHRRDTGRTVLTGQCS